MSSWDPHGKPPPHGGMPGGWQGTSAPGWTAPHPHPHPHQAPPQPAAYPAPPAAYPAPPAAYPAPPGAYPQHAGGHPAQHPGYASPHVAPAPHLHGQSEEARWLARGVRPEQYRVFHDDPDMLERIAANAEREKAEEGRERIDKPWWWVALSGTIGLGMAAASLFLGYQQLGELPHEIGPLSAFIGGTAAFYGVSGWKAGNYENTRTGEKKVLWSKMGIGMRVLVTGASILLLGVGFTAGLWAGTMF